MFFKGDAYVGNNTGSPLIFFWERGRHCLRTTERMTRYSFKPWPSFCMKGSKFAS